MTTKQELQTELDALQIEHGLCPKAEVPVEIAQFKEAMVLAQGLRPKFNQGPVVAEVTDDGDVMLDISCGYRSCLVPQRVVPALTQWLRKLNGDAPPSVPTAVAPKRNDKSYWLGVLFGTAFGAGLALIVMGALCLMQ